MSIVRGPRGHECQPLLVGVSIITFLTAANDDATKTKLRRAVFILW